MADELAYFYQAFNEEMYWNVVSGAAGYDFAEHLEAENKAVTIFFFPADFGHYILDLADHVLDDLEVRGSLFVFYHDGVLVHIIFLLLDPLS